VLRIGDVQDPDSLNPYLSNLDIIYDLSSLVYSYLIISDDHGVLVGDLATAVPTIGNGGISTDGRTYTYHLHRGVLWHDGSHFTARDVVASWHAVMDPKNNTLHREGFDRIAAIDTPDDYTVVVHLKRRYPPFVTQFFAPLQEGAKPVLPAHILRQMSNFNTGSLSTHPVGTGPFEFVSWKRGQGLELRRFPAYFKGTPKLERIEVHIFPEDSAMFNETSVHHIDLVAAPAQARVQSYRALPGFVTQIAPWNAQQALVFNIRRPALHDVAVRQAIAYAIDDRAFIEKVTHGVGEPAYNSLPATAIGYTRLPPYAQNPKRANALLDNAGWRRGSDGIRSKNGNRLSFALATIAGAPTMERIALLMQTDLHAVGIEMEIKPYPFGLIYSADGPMYKGTYDATIVGTTLNWDPNVIDYLGCDKWYPKGNNVYGYCNPQLDELEEAGLQTDDTARRAAIYEKASRIIWNTLPYLPLYEYRRLVVRSSDLQNYSVNPTSTPWWNAWQWDI
jgi:peptide/nickel transport system substrate-binding protein